MKGTAENPFGTNKTREALTHHSGRIVSKCEKDDFTGFCWC